MKVAIVHDWLVTYGGAERSLTEILDMFPQADLFTLVDYMDGPRAERLRGRTPRTSFVQRLPFARRKYRGYLPAMMVAVEQFDLTGYDLVISSSHAVAKGVITGPDQLHIAYTYSPIRYAWDLQHAYLKEARLERGLKSIFARSLLHYVRMWDQRTAPGVDHFIGISQYIARRIRKAYGRDAAVVYPPVDTERFTPGPIRDDFYVTASRMVPYKRIPLIAEAFAAMPDKKLVIIGDGPEMKAVRKAASSNVLILGSQSHEVLLRHLQLARAFVFAAEEDFGIAPIEAQACGTPVIAYGRGAALETIRGLDAAEPTGVFFAEQTVAAVTAAVREFEANAERIDPAACRRNAERFSAASFKANFLREVNEQIERRFGSGPPGLLPSAPSLAAPGARSDAPSGKVEPDLTVSDTGRSG